MRDYELIKEEIAKSEKTQKEVAREVGVTRTTLNKYLNGHDYISDEIKKSIATVVNSPKLRKKFFGTTSSNVIFDIDYNNIFEILTKMETEMEELQAAIEVAKEKLVNSGHKNQMTKEQIDAVEYLLQQNEDVNQCNDILDMAFKHRGFSLEKRNKEYINRCKRKYDLILTEEDRRKMAYV